MHISCTVAATGRLTRCTAYQEDPPGWGFAEAGLKLASVIIARPQTRDGVPNDNGVIILPFRFVQPH